LFVLPYLAGVDEVKMGWGAGSVVGLHARRNALRLWFTLLVMKLTTAPRHEFLPSEVPTKGHINHQRCPPVLDEADASPRPFSTHTTLLDVGIEYRVAPYP
jgi:hypothetical protein